MKTELLEVRLQTTEKQAFKESAELAGLSMSAWIRERLRKVAKKELEEVGKKVAFLEEKEM